MCESNTNGWVATLAAYCKTNSKQYLSFKLNIIQFYDNFKLKFNTHQSCIKKEIIERKIKYINDNVNHVRLVCTII